jgi:hypothetical protein
VKWNASLVEALGETQPAKTATDNQDIFVVNRSHCDLYFEFVLKKQKNKMGGVRL